MSTSRDPAADADEVPTALRVLARAGSKIHRRPTPDLLGARVAHHVGGRVAEPNRCTSSRRVPQTACRSGKDGCAAVIAPGGGGVPACRGSCTGQRNASGRSPESHRDRSRGRVPCSAFITAISRASADSLPSQSTDHGLSAYEAAWNEGRLYSTVLVAPRRERRRDRRARKAAAKAVLAEDRDSRRAVAKAKADELAGRAAHNRRVAQGRRTWTRCAAVRPVGFGCAPIADALGDARGCLPVPRRGRARGAGYSSAGPLLGQLVRLRPVGALRTGHDHRPEPGARRDGRLGKSALAKSLYTRSIPFGRRVYVPGDPKGEHTAVAEAVGGKAIILGHGMATGSTHSTKDTGPLGSTTYSGQPK